MPNLNPNSTNYVHSYEPNTNDLTMAMTYNEAGEPCLRVITYTENGEAVTDRLTAGDKVAVLSTAGVFTTPGSIIPNVDTTFDLGSVDRRWQSLYLGPGTIVITDTVTGADASITVSDGVLQIDGADQLQVGQLKFVDNTIQSTTPDIDVQVGQLADTADLVLNRNVIIGTGKTITFPDGTVQSTAAGALADDDYTVSISNNVVSVINLPANTAIGPIEQLSFNTSYTHQEVRVEGTLCWDPDDRTLNLTHPNDVVQQIGQELYGKVRNNTGSTITNGTAVRFAGASMNGTARLEVAPFEADGAFPSLYAFGIATQDIADGEDGLVTAWGKVRDIDTTGAGENWQVGNILYVSPTTAGALTNVKPTAPNNVVPIAAVLRVDATAGEIFVRPTVEQKKSYGKFERTTDLAVAATNTAYVIDFDTTEIANGVERVVGNTTRLQVDQSGLYQIDISAQVNASGGGFSSGTMYMWVRKNGVDVADSTRRQGVLGSAPSANISFVVVISLAADDYVEIGYAGDSTNLRFDAAAATAFAPSTAAVKVGVTQIQL